jgi:hypothetical protein
MMKLVATLCALPLVACATDSIGEDGLDLAITETDHIAGSYTEHGVSLAFDFHRGGERHVMTFHDADGNELVATTVEPPFQTTRILGGRLVASGIPNTPDPTITGDRDAQAELDARPEAGLLEGLHDHLAVLDIDPDLYAPEPPKLDSVYNYNGRYFLFGVDERKDFLSAAGASPTYIHAKNPWPNFPGYCGAVWLSPWSPASSDYMIVPSWGSTSKTKYWWGAIFTVSTMPWVFTSWDGGVVCAPTGAMLIRVSPYVWSP